MYTAAETKQLQKATAELLKQPTGPLSDKELQALHEVLRFHEHRYYILNDPLISDYEYDQLYKWLERTEAEDPSRITPDSPTQRVALGITREFVTVQHLVPMLSLENSYNAEDLRDWDRKARELSGLDVLEYSVEPKFDGASISLIYDNDLLERGATRGDGAYGDDITTNIRQIRSVPLSAKFSERGIRRVEIRGEVLMTKEHFKNFNEQLMAQGTPPLANPRNAAAGSLRMKDPKEVSRRNLEAFLYHISFVEAVPRKQPSQQLQHHSQCLELLWELGFRSPVKEVKVLKGIEKVISHCLAFEQERDDLPYEIDGMVIKVDDTVLQEKMGMTSHHPRWAIAYKFKARQATSKLLAVEYQVGRTGSVTPVAKIEPVPIGGVTVSSISLFNEEVIKEKDLMIGDSVLVERAGDVIPYIVKSLADLRKGTEKKIHFPHNCPVCGSRLEKPEAEAVWRCNNFDCPAQVVERIIHFTSKDAMDIRGFGEANIRKFVDLGFLEDIPGIYSLPYDKIRELEGFGDKSTQKLQQAIEASKEQPLHRLLFALGIRYVGETTAKVLANAVHHILDFQEKTIEELQEMEDVGPKVASSIHAFFHDKGNVHLIKKLESIGLKVTSEKKTLHREGALADKTFLFTGTLTALKRSEAESMVEANGGKLLSGVSSKLDYLVVGEDAGSKLEKAKKIPSVKILTEEEFLRLAGK